MVYNTKNRSYFDRQMLERYNANVYGNNYHAPVWPTPRTQYDINLQNKWCPGVCNSFPGPS